MVRRRGRPRGQRATSSVDRRIERGLALREQQRKRLAAAALRRRVVAAAAAADAAASPTARERQAKRLKRFRDYWSGVAAAAAAAGSSAPAAGSSAPRLGPAAGSSAPRRRDDGDGRDGHAHRRASASGDGTAGSSKDSSNRLRRDNNPTPGWDSPRCSSGTRARSTTGRSS